ncbi:Acyl-CoA-binding protein, ACBP [Moelleriella libera RCEF 2490]|uniref:Acyl-CoA-binding protein, ACBP n=1 Tax=Moelleriella libera RCEF 2490 TaxID=1081109 RepID=A0A168F739_9HYPO|nr:Acyl-CoA-binding protein, ACBP [Moelleriella libera RCEF 2490]
MVEHKKTDNPEFDAAVEEVNKFKEGGVQVSQKNQLRLYGCYKVGCGQTVEKPGMFGGFDRKYMYEAYKQVKEDEGKSAKEAQDAYIALANKLKSGDNSDWDA